MIIDNKNAGWLIERGRNVVCCQRRPSTAGGIRKKCNAVYHLVEMDYTRAELTGQLTFFLKKSQANWSLYTRWADKLESDYVLTAIKLIELRQDKSMLA